MIDHPAYVVEPWCLRETELDFNVPSQSKSVFALSNGHVGWRGTWTRDNPKSSRLP
jgi:alpha,alpha-trehalose phosphorylase